MSETWTSPDPDPRIKIGPLGWVLFLLRAVPFAILCFGGCGILLLVRLVERPLCGLKRPVTPYISQFVARVFFLICGIRYKVTGRPMPHRGAVVSNHTSWTDIFALMASLRGFFVSKAEVANWFGVGLLTKATGTVFIKRDRREARKQQQIFVDRLLAGHQLIFFPEGTSTDGHRVLAFKSTLFSAFMVPELRDELHIQPVTLVYHAPEGLDDRFYGWWGDMDFGSHLARIMGHWRQGSVEVIFHAPLKVADFPDRKALALACEEAVRSGLPWDWQLSR